MIELRAAEVPAVIVETSEKGGLSSDQITDLCCRKILYVSEDAPPVIQEQAEAFRERISIIVCHYVKEAMRSEKDRCVQIALDGGYKDLADLLRRV
jgi:hypothetical protein